MSGPEWYRWNPSKWLAGTLGLTNEQRGVYIQVINVILDRGSCPDDEDYLKRLCNLQRRPLRRILNELVALGKLTPKDGNFEQNRAKLERKESETFVEKQRNRARKGWQTKRLDDAISGNANHNHNHNIDSESDTTSENPSRNVETLFDRGVQGVAPNGAQKTAKASKRKKPAVPIPEHWTPDLDFAREKGLSDREINAQANKFVDGAHQHDRRYVDWDAAWRNWVRNYLEWRDARPGLH